MMSLLAMYSKLALYSPAVETIVVIACAIRRKTSAITAMTTSSVTMMAITRGSLSHLTWKSSMGETKATMNSATTKGIITARV